MFSVIFEVHSGEGKKDEYLGHAKTLKPLLEAIDGFIDNERFESRSRPGWVLSHSTWRDEKSVIRWRTQAKHHGIQETGHSTVFSDYHLRVGEITSDTHPPHGVSIREQRFDVTEVGRSKLCTLLELTPRDGCELPKGEDAMLGAIRLARGAPGLEAVEVYDSIYNPGNCWFSAPGRNRRRQGLQPGPVAGTEITRRRTVRVIRDYGMFDRRETPQYYPEVEWKALTSLGDAGRSENRI